MRIAICDDRCDQLTEIRTATEQYFSTNSEQNVQIRVYDSAFFLLDSLNQTGGFDIVLLDICMPGISGTEIAREIRHRKDKTEIVFLTGSDEYAVDAFALKAAHYLLKPFSQAQFCEAMDRAMLPFRGGAVKNLIVKPEGGGAQAIDINDISFIESCGHVLTVHTVNGTVTEGQRSLSRLAEELEKLRQGQFISPYKGYIVNLKAIRVIEPEQIILGGGDHIPIPKRGYRKLQNIYLDYIFSGEGKREGIRL